jgi:hypothetical protein
MAAETARANPITGRPVTLSVGSQGNRIDRSCGEAIDPEFL